MGLSGKNLENRSFKNLEFYDFLKFFSFLRVFLQLFIALHEISMLMKIWQEYYVWHIKDNKCNGKKCL